MPNWYGYGNYGATTTASSNWVYATDSTTASATYTWWPNTYYSTQTLPLQQRSVEELQRDYEEIARREAERRQAQAEQERERAEAVRQAEELLRSCLGEERLAEYKTKGCLSVDSPSKPGRRYVVDAHSRIKVYEADKLVDELCVHLVDPLSLANDSRWLPEPDVVLGKVWLIENDEERLLRVANHNRR